MLVRLLPRATRWRSRPRALRVMLRRADPVGAKHAGVRQCAAITCNPIAIADPVIGHIARRALGLRPSYLVDVSLAPEPDPRPQPHPLQSSSSLIRALRQMRRCFCWRHRSTFRAPSVPARCARTSKPQIGDVPVIGQLAPFAGVEKMDQCARPCSARRFYKRIVLRCGSFPACAWRRASPASASGTSTIRSRDGRERQG